MIYAALALIVTYLSLATSLLKRLGVLSLFQRAFRCHHCGKATSLERVPRFKYDKLIGVWISCQRYVCHACGWTGLIRTSVKENTSAKSTRRPRS